MNPHTPKIHHSRGYLPHYDPGSEIQTIVINLDDSIPRVLVDRWKKELAYAPTEERKKELFERAERYLDAGRGSCYLNRPYVAEMVNDSIQNLEGRKYLLFGWAIMPNHAHLVLQPNDEIELSEIMHSIKSYTATKANKLLGRKGRFWQPDYFDRVIRDDDHFRNAINYVEMNPVKAGLCAKKELWRWSSAFRQGTDSLRS